MRGRPASTDAGFSRPIPLHFGDHGHAPRGFKTSHTVALLAVAVVAFLGAMQVISTQAQGDEAILRELSEKVRVAEVSSGVSGFSIASPLTSSVESSTASPLPSRPAAQVEIVSATEQAPEHKEEAALEPSPEPAAETEPSLQCIPDSGGAPYCVYVVQEGDTLSTIAEELGLAGTTAFSAAELIALSNSLNDAQNWLILVDQELRVPLESGVIHTVGDSETVSVLAELYGVAPEDIVTANGLADANAVVAGGTLLIPSPVLWPLGGPMAAEAQTNAGEATQAAEQPTETPGDASQTETALAAPASPEPEPPEAEAEATPEAQAGALLAAPQPDTARASTSENANPSVTQIRDLFAEGYIAAAGPPQYLEYLLGVVIPCESGYNLRAFNPAGPFYGLMQFLPQTWANTGGGDWFDAWQQGYNTGILLRTSNPASQWPVCWF